MHKLSVVLPKIRQPPTKENREKWEGEKERKIKGFGLELGTVLGKRERAAWVIYPAQLLLPWGVKKIKGNE